MTGKVIGKIQDVYFGYGGYQDAMIGARFTLGSDKDSWSCVDFWGDWALDRSSSAKWTESERIINLGEMCMKVAKVLSKAKKSTIEDLKGVPIEATFDCNLLKEWRVLEEVI